MCEHVGVRAPALALALALSRVAGRAVLRGVVGHPATAGGRWSAGLLSVGHGGGVVVYVRGAVAGVMETCKRGIAVLLHAFTGHTKTNNRKRILFAARIKFESGRWFMYTLRS